MAGGITGGRGSGKYDPVFWPKGVPGQNLQPSNVEESQGINRNVGATPSSSAAQQAETVTRPAPVKPAERTAPPPPVQDQPAVWAMAITDVVDQLFKLQKPPTQDNKMILLSLLEHGLAASEENFDLVTRLRKGKNNSKSIESAVIALAKDLSSSPRSVDVLTAFLAGNTKTTAQLQQLQQSLNAFYGLLQGNQSMFEKGLFTGLSAIVSDLDDTLKKLLKKSTDTSLNIPKMNRGDLIRNLTVFNSFLSGLSHQLQLADGDPMPLQRHLAKMQGEIKEFVHNLTSQIILSKDSARQHTGMAEKFAYWQIPNPLLQVPRNIDILVRKDPQQKTRKINPAKTRIVIRFETPGLGEIAIVIDILDNKVWYVFHTGSDETKQFINQLSADLRDRMKALNYDTMGVRTVPRKLDLKKLLLPTFNLDNISRVRTEI